MAVQERALIVGAGSGLSAAIARRCARDGMAVVLAARNVDKLAPLARETGATTIACNAADPAEVDKLFAAVDGAGGSLDLAVYNASARARGPIIELDADAVDHAVRVT